MRLLAISAWTVTSVSKSAFLAILQGQLSLLIAGAIGLALIKTGPQATTWRVIALVLSAIKPSYAVCTFPIVVALRDVRSLALASAAIIALLCSSICIYGPGIVIDYPGVLLSYSQGMNFSFYTNPVHIGSLIPIDRQLLSMFGISIAVIFTVAGLYFRKMSLASCATISFLLTAPYVGPYELVLFFLPVVALEADRATRSTPPDSAHPENS